MREFVNKHPILYWSIVLWLAFIVFTVITIFGFGKLEKAEAAVNEYVFEYYTDALRAKRDESKPYYMYLYKWQMKEDGSVHPNSYECFLVESDAVDIVFYLSSSHMYAVDNVTWKDGVALGLQKHGSSVGFSSDYVQHLFYLDGNMNVDVSVLPESFIFEDFRPIPQEFSSAAPYMTFKSLIVENKLNKSHDVTVNEAERLYSEYFATSNWDFIYNLKNISELDTGYKLNLKFEIELPTLAYVRGVYEDLGYNFESARTILRRNSEAIKYWFKDKNADSRTVVIDYSMEVTPSVYDIVSYQFTYMEWEYLLRALNTDLNAEFEGYDARERAALLSFMHVKKVTTEVITSRGDSEIYGGYTTNVFERGVYDTCVDVYTAVDKNFVAGDLLEDLISDDVKVAEREYLKQLEQRVEDLQNQVDNMTGSLGSFDVDFDGNAFWSAVRSVGAGLLTLSNFLLALVAIIGGFFVFLPFDMQQIVGYLVIVTACVILWKAFKK